MRHFRGVRYHIQVERCGPGRAVTLTVDGQAVPGNLVPLPSAGVEDVLVEVSLT